MRISRAHGFDFASSWLKLLQCTDAKKLFALPQGIEADLWLLQSRPVECEHVTRGRARVHAFEMPRQQCLHAIIAKVAGLDDGHWSQDIPACARDVKAEELLTSGRA